jgi:hypothetical protein
MPKPFRSAFKIKFLLEACPADQLWRDGAGAFYRNREPWLLYAARSGRQSGELREEWALWAGHCPLRFPFRLSFQLDRLEQAPEPAEDHKAQVQLETILRPVRPAGFEN